MNGQPEHKRNVWPAAGWFVLYFAAALLPRYLPVLRGAVFADDLVHRPEGHLLSYRFLNYLELSLWERLFGAHYLLSSAPKIIGCIYTGGVCSLLRLSMLRWGARAEVATVVPLLIPLHPLWNTFIVWNVATVYVLSLLLTLLGYFLLAERRRLIQAAIGVVLIALGISGYQVHAGLLPALVFLELTLRKYDARTATRVALERLFWIGMAAALYLAATSLAAFAGIHTWGGRGLAPAVIDKTAILNRLHAMIDNIATVTQPLLSFYGGIRASWRLWWAPFVLTAAVTAACLHGRQRLFAGSCVFLPFIAAAMIVPLNVVPTGPRVAAAIWMATAIGVVPLAQWLATHRTTFRLIALLAAALMVPVCVADARNRVRAWDADRRTVRAIAHYWDMAGIPRSSVTIAIGPSPLRSPEGAAWKARPIVMQNFHPVTSWEYSNLRVCPAWLFGAFGFSHVLQARVEGAGSGEESSILAHWVYLRDQRCTVVSVFREYE